MRAFLKDALTYAVIALAVIGCILLAWLPWVVQ